MNSPSNTPDLPANSGVGDSGYNRSSKQPFYWSVRRELWENRSIYVAPLIVAVVVLFGSFVSSFHLPERRRMAMLLDPAHRRAAIEMHVRYCGDDDHHHCIHRRRLLLSRCSA